MLNKSGNVRQAALSVLTQSPDTAFFVAALVWRLNDWVQPVRRSAEDCANRVLPQMSVQAIVGRLRFYWNTSFATRPHARRQLCVKLGIGTYQMPREADEFAAAPRRSGVQTAGVRTITVGIVPYHAASGRAPTHRRATVRPWHGARRMFSLRLGALPWPASGPNFRVGSGKLILINRKSYAPRHRPTSPRPRRTCPGLPWRTCRR